MAVVVSVHRARERSAAAEELPAANVVQGFGIEGDFRSARKDRHVTLIEEETLRAVERQLGVTIAPGGSRRQIVVQGMTLNPTVGKTLRIGEVLLAVTSFCDPCVKMEWKIGPGARAALANRGGVCALVVSGGIIHPGDEVELIADSVESVELLTTAVS
jgi:MOSC domain-containing protein YiiM